MKLSALLATGWRGSVTLSWAHSTEARQWVLAQPGLGVPRKGKGSPYLVDTGYSTCPCVHTAYQSILWCHQAPSTGRNKTCEFMLLPSTPALPRFCKRICANLCTNPHPKVRASSHHSSHACANHRPQQSCLRCLMPPVLSLKWGGSDSGRVAPHFPRFPTRE